MLGGEHRLDCEHEESQYQALVRLEGPKLSSLSSWLSAKLSGLVPAQMLPVAVDDPSVSSDPQAIAKEVQSFFASQGTH